MLILTILATTIVLGSLLVGLLRAGFATVLRRIGSVFYAWAVSWEQFRMELTRLEQGAMGQPTSLLPPIESNPTFTLTPAAEPVLQTQHTLALTPTPVGFTPAPVPQSCQC